MDREQAFNALNCLCGFYASHKQRVDYPTWGSHCRVATEKLDFASRLLSATPNPEKAKPIYERIFNGDHVRVIEEVISLTFTDQDYDTASGLLVLLREAVVAEAESETAV